MSLFPARTIDIIRSRLTMVYADWRSGATPTERRSYNQTDMILLSFDDFAEPATIDRFLAILKQKNVVAAFFLQGDWATENPQTVTKIRSAGHIIGNHTATHPHLRSLSDNKIKQEIMGGPASTLLRPPYGDCDKRVRQIAAQLGYKLALWTIDSEDWKGISAATIQDRVMREIHPGACVLMHLNAPNTLAALPGLIDSIRAQGDILWTGGKLG